RSTPVSPIATARQCSANSRLRRGSCSSAASRSRRLRREPDAEPPPERSAPMPLRQRSLVVAALALAVLAESCSKTGGGPTAPRPPATGQVVLISHPAAATVLVNGALVSRYTPCSLDTAAATYAIRLSLLGYADTTLSVTIPASPETVSVALRPLAGT